MRRQSEPEAALVVRESTYGAAPHCRAISGHYSDRIAPYWLPISSLVLVRSYQRWATALPTLPT